MRIAIDTSYAARGPSGTAVYVESLAHALREAGTDVVELRQPARLRRGGRNKARSGANAALDAVWTRELLPRAAKRAGADVLHHPLPARARVDIPQVVTVHDVAFARRPEDFDPVWRRFALRTHRAAIARAAVVVCVSQTSARDAIAWLRARPEQIVVAPHGPGQELPQVGEREREWFLYVGDDEPRKNVAGLRSEHERYRSLGGRRDLVVAGAAGAGQIDPARLAELYAGAAALVHPSRDEGFGLTLLEAMAAGTPVIAARNAAVEELAGDTALIVEDHELGGAMLRLEGEEPLRRTMGMAGRRRAAEFSWQRSARAHIEAYT